MSDLELIRDFVNTVDLEDGEDKLDWPYRVLAGSLGVGLVYDLPESMLQVQRHARLPA